MEVPQKLSSWSRVLFLRMYSEELKTGTRADICTITSTVVLFTAAEGGSDPSVW